MPTQIAIGFSQASDPQEAAYQACIQAKNQLNTVQTDLVVLLTSIHYARPEVLEVVHASLRPHRLVGSSTAGILLSEGVFTRGIGILAINSDLINFGISAVNAAEIPNVRTAGFELARKVSADFKSPHRQACLVFTDRSFHQNSLFIRGCQEILGFGLPLIGAVSSDDFKFKKTHQFYQKQVFSNASVGLVLGGINVAMGSKHGFKPLGKPRTITRASSNIIHTIDQKPAMHIYEEFMGAEAQQLKKGIFASHTALYPLGIYLEEERQYLIKNAVDILADGSIVCQGEVPQGAEVHLMIGNRDSCKQSAADAAQQVKDALGGRQAKLILIIESMARHKILGRLSFLEIQAIRDILGYTTPTIGMYTFGEIAPFASLNNIKNTHMQNESILILAID